MSDPIREDQSAAKTRRARNIALALGLVVFVILVYVVTLFQMGANVIDRPL